MTRIMIGAAASAIVIIFAGSETSTSEAEAIKKTALDYGQGWYEGNAERMEEALHPDLAKRVLTVNPRSGKGMVDHMSAMSLVQATRKGYGVKTPTDKRRTDITILDVYGNAACVKL
ncbi:MAG: nuclear transport factor 2 family protein, partial [Phycisphaerae bacterium]